MLVVRVQLDHSAGIFPTMGALIFVLITVAAFIALALAWVLLIGATGGSIAECDRADCGTLGDFTMETTWPLVPIALLAGALLVAWAVSSRIRR